MINSNFTFWIYGFRKWRRVWIVSNILLSVLAVTAVAQSATNIDLQAQTAPFSLGKVFTFLFLTLGPLKIIAPFADMTRGQDKTFKRKLAIQGILIGALGMLAATTLGASILQSWGVSSGGLLLAAGIVLFLIALETVLAQYKPKIHEEPHPTNIPAASSSLAFSPLAFPTIVTPYGIAVLILLATLRSEHLPEIFAVTAGILVLDFLVMLFADLILKSPIVSIILGIFGSVVGILQVALGIEVVLDGLFTLGLI